MFSFLFHADLSAFDNVVFLLNSAGAAAAWWFNRKAYLDQTVDLKLRRLFFIMAGRLSAIYSIAHILLLIFDIDVFAWGSVMRGVSLLVWPIVWIGPAFIIERQSRSVKEQLAIGIARQIKREVAPSPKEIEEE